VDGWVGDVVGWVGGWVGDVVGWVGGLVGDSHILFSVGND
jgi:hypothetical protein